MISVEADSDYVEITIDEADGLSPAEIMFVLYHVMQRENLLTTCSENHIHIVLLRPESYYDQPQEVLH